jgi:hypothetical protein
LSGWSAGGHLTALAMHQPAVSAGLVQVDYEVLPAVVDQESATKPGAPLLHDDVPGNTARRGREVFRQSEGRLPLAQRPEPRPQFGYTIVRSMMRRSSAR